MPRTQDREPFFGLPAAALLALPAALLLGFVVAGRAGLGLALVVVTLALAIGAIVKRPGQSASILLRTLPLLAIGALPATALGGQRPYDAASFATCVLIGAAAQGVIYLVTMRKRSS